MTIIYLVIFSVFQGIGRATALLLAECGANVIALTRTQTDLDSLKTQVINFLVSCMA
jgi:NAD(P)-dependent dehydrogenase (short-subunit alcohol dehydrogenase family)